MMGWSFGVPHEEFTVIRLREDDEASTRWRKTLKAIYQFRPTVVFIDGMLDIVEDFNDNVECARIIYQAMKVASHYNAALWCVVHENPGSDKPAGHIGSTFERKVTDWMRVVKKNEGGRRYYVLTQTKARGHKEADDIKYEIVDDVNGFGIPMQMEVTTDEPESPKAETYVCVEMLTYEQLMEVSLLITSHDGLSTREIREGVKGIFGVGAAKADKILKRCIECKIIARGENLRYYLPGSDEQTEVPF